VRDRVWRAPRILEAGLAAFGGTLGALLIFARHSGSALEPFIVVGARVVRDVVLPLWVSALVGVLVHLGQCLALGAATVYLREIIPSGSRLRAALLVLILWQLAALLPWIAVIRADLAIHLTIAQRIVIAVLVGAALAYERRSARA